MEGYTVMRIPKEQTYEWLLKKHYAHRIPPISFAFGLYCSDVLKGVCTFGIPASRFEDMQQPYELNRLVVDDGLEKNTLSWFVQRCIKQFPEKPAIIVSYADPNYGHHGYIYQATNWIYTGGSVAHPNWYLNGKLLHEKTIFNMFGTNSVSELQKKGIDVKQEKTLPKHRYFYFIGNKKQKKELLASLKYPILPYPKGDNQNYDASYEPRVQGLLL